MVVFAALRPAAPATRAPVAPAPFTSRGLCGAAAAALAAARPGRCHLVGRRAEVGGNVDFAIIQFKIPGFDDLSQLPRVITTIAVALLAYNHYLYPDSAVGAMSRTEALAIVLAGCCWVLPWMAGRLEEAARRQIVARPVARTPGALQTLAIEAALPSAARLDLAWATAALLRLTNADGLAVWRGGAVVCTRGLLRQLPGFAGGAGVLPVLSKAWQPGEVDGYCATSAGLGAFPATALPTGVLPTDTESALAKPLLGGGLLVLWSAQPRAFDRAADRRWVAAVADKLGAVLPPGEGGAVPALTSAEECFEAPLPFGQAMAAGEENRDPFARYDGEVRLAPAGLGLLSLGAMGANRVALVGSTVMEVDPAQSRADLLCGALATTLLMQGLVWISETPAKPEIEDTSTWEDAEDVLDLAKGLTPALERELRWAWSALASCTRICSMVVFWQDLCLMQGGLFQSRRVGGVRPKLGALCREVISTGRGRYLAQLKNYPAKDQFLSFLPAKTQGLVLTPLKAGADAPTSGVLILGVDCVRGVGKVDQAWIASLGERLAVALEACFQELAAAGALAGRTPTS